MIPLHKVLMTPDAVARAGKTLVSGLITEGPRVKEFEELLADCLGVPVLTTNSCTSAIDMALHLIGVGPGDEVVATPMTCAATNTHVVLRGARLIWADVNSETGNIDPASVAQCITEKTKAIIVVDWGGRPVDCDEIRRLLPRPIPIIQDAAHSFMAKYEDGALAHCDDRSGDYVCWSFQAIKHLTTGDGGALKTPPDQFDRARRIRWFGIDRDTKVKFRFLQDIKEAGYKYHMNDVAASIGIGNLENAAGSLDSYRSNAKRLSRMLHGLRVVKAPPPSTGSSWWFYSLRMPNWQRFVDYAEGRGVGAGPVHGRNDSYTAFGSATKPLPGLDLYNAQHVAVPCGWWVLDPSIVAAVVLEWDDLLCGERS